MSMTCTTAQLYAAAATPTMNRRDTELVQSIAAGDKHAMKILFARHNVRIFRFLLRFVGDRSSAEDLVSEVFLDVWRRASKFQTRSQVSTWLLAIARNKALSTLRRRSNEELDDEKAAAIEDPTQDQEAAMENRQNADILHNCLIQLSPPHREVIDLVYYHDKSVDEASEIIGIPQNIIKTRMFYARKRIAELKAAQGIDRSVIHT
jgi:RNA polymerase sigma-70 factor (ECF subfamily)